VNRLILFLLSLLVASTPLAAAEASAPSIRPSAPVKDLILPSFDKDGKKSSFMRAAEATFVSTTQVEVKEMQLTLFTKDGTGSFDTVLLAPSATFLTDQQIVSGQESIRLIRLDAEVSGEQWSYNHLEKRIVINKNVRVTFLEELKAIIK
jgi:hypothetical protein